MNRKNKTRWSIDSRYVIQRGSLKISWKVNGKINFQTNKCIERYQEYLKFEKYNVEFAYPK